MAQVLMIDSILVIAEENSMTMSGAGFIFRSSVGKIVLFKIVRKLFRGLGYVIEITQHLRKQEMVSRCDL